MKTSKRMFDGADAASRPIISPSRVIAPWVQLKGVGEMTVTSEVS